MQTHSGGETRFVGNFYKIQLNGWDFHQDHHSIILCMYERILLYLT